MSVFVLAVIGESPAVLTELLWWLEVQEASHVAGIEVWTTARGASRLRGLVAGPVWRGLQAAARIRLPELLPAGEPKPFDMRIHVWAAAGIPLDDVRSAAEVNAVNATLNERVRSLCRALPETTQLVGSLAGGRKTVSAALQTAFSLQSRRGDRLVHVVLDSDFENRLREMGCIGQFSYPTEAWAKRTGVSLESQMLVYTVPYPRLRELKLPRLQKALDQPWEAVWPALDRCGQREISALLFPTSPGPHGVSGRVAKSGWTYRLVDAETLELLHEIPLSWALGWTLAGIASLQNATMKSLQTWLDTHDGWRPSSDTQAQREGLLRSTVSTLRGKLRFPPGFESFELSESGYSLYGVEVMEGPPEQAG